MPDKHLKYGATGFNAKASPSQINRFINNLSEDKKQSLFEVSEELKSVGMIETTGEQTKKHFPGMFNKNKK